MTTHDSIAVGPGCRLQFGACELLLDVARSVKGRTVFGVRDFETSGTFKTSREEAGAPSYIPKLCTLSHLPTTLKVRMALPISPLRRSLLCTLANVKQWDKFDIGGSKVLGLGFNLPIRLSCPRYMVSSAVRALRFQAL